MRWSNHSSAPHLPRRPEVGVGERRARQVQPESGHERQGLRGEQPSRRRVLRRVGVEARRHLGEGDGGVAAVQVDGGPGRRAAERPRVAQLAGGQRLFREAGARHRADGQVAAEGPDHQRKRLGGGLVELLLELLQRSLGHRRRQPRRQQRRQQGSERREPVLWDTLPANQGDIEQIVEPGRRLAGSGSAVVDPRRRARGCRPSRHACDYSAGHRLLAKRVRGPQTTGPARRWLLTSCCGVEGTPRTVRPRRPGRWRAGERAQLVVHREVTGRREQRIQRRIHP